MIKGFEDETKPLSLYETKSILPRLVDGLSKRIGLDLIVTNAEMIGQLRRENYSVNPARIRKLINHIRVKGLIKNLISTSRGYYVASKQQEVRDCITSLEQRESAIYTVRKALESQLSEWESLDKQENLFG